MAKSNKKTNKSANASSSNVKRTAQIENPDNFLKKYPVWRFKRNDKIHDKWSIRHCCNFNEDVMDKLQSFEGLTWYDIINTNGIDAHHYVDASKLIKPAQQRLHELKIYDDQLFSLRLNGKTRLYGLLSDGIYSILWYDSNHEIYTSKKKNT